MKKNTSVAKRIEKIKVKRKGIHSKKKELWIKEL